MDPSYKPVYHSSICLSFESEAQYQDCMKNHQTCRAYLDSLYADYPELFPAEWSRGYVFHGFVFSKKQQLLMRRIRTWSGKAFQIRPSFVLPYMVARTEEVEKALFLRRWGVSFDALSYVFGAYPMFWYRAYVSLGRNRVVGTTVKENMPQDLTADEKHTWIKGKKAFLTTTVAEGCILGSALVSDADTEALTSGYRVFQEEAREVEPGYSPRSVNTDGWDATQNAWHLLFPLVQIVLCFLHAFLSIRNCCKRNKPLLKELGDRIWDAYDALKLNEFAQRIRRLREWTKKNLAEGIIRDKVLSLCQKAPQFKVAFDLPGCHRTSQEVDRLINFQDRLLYAMHYFQGDWKSAQLHVRAMALLWNFHPYSLALQQNSGRGSPFADLNGFHYHENWLQNLLIAASMRGRRC